MSLTADTEKIESLARDLPDPAAARRFFFQLAEKHRAAAARLLRPANQGLLADCLALAADSPFLATTLLQHPEYIAWLGRKRSVGVVGGSDELLESLGRFSLVNSELEPHVLLSRFRRRELLRIYLRDLRGLATVAETTEELSNLADAIVEHALRLARQELVNRFGLPLDRDDKGKAAAAKFCVVALGKLGSRELNYASDIDLLFLYSNHESPASADDSSSRDKITNREFFVKLAERISKIIGQPTGEGAAYRVDLRLRPHGRVGALAVSLGEAIAYYQTAARDWERQVLLRARAAAGDAEIFRRFAKQIEPVVYRETASVTAALDGVLQSKQKINQEHRAEPGFNVKLGRGGIREIEFVAQGLQLAHGGRDAWLRAPHTLVALRRLADHGLLSDDEFAALSDAYAFLRLLEHRLQMENGLQTHALPENETKRRLVARRMQCTSLDEFDERLRAHTARVSRVFERVFNDSTTGSRTAKPLEAASEIKRSEFQTIGTPEKEIVESNPAILPPGEFNPKNYGGILREAVGAANSLRDELAALRLAWKEFYEEISEFDRSRRLSIAAAKRAQTALAEASLEAALLVAEKELKRRYDELRIANCELRIGVLGLGKLGSRGMDYGSDLDLILIYDDERAAPVKNLALAEFYGRAVETLVTALSSLTREGFLYRVDLRLRPDGKNGAPAVGANAFLNYLQNRAAVWEWLAYVKLRAAAGDLPFAGAVEDQARKIVHEAARKLNVSDLQLETRRVRDRLEAAKTDGMRRGEIDLKHGAGGLLDVYFAVRFLQLRDNVPDDAQNRSTAAALQNLRAAGSLGEPDFAVLSTGYEFLQRLDHFVRLVAGRSAKLSVSPNPLLAAVSERMKISSPNETLEQIVDHTSAVRNTYDKLLK